MVKDIFQSCRTLCGRNNVLLNSTNFISRCPNLIRIHDHFCRNIRILEQQRRGYSFQHCNLSTEKGRKAEIYKGKLPIIPSSQEAPDCNLEFFQGALYNASQRRSQNV